MMDTRERLSSTEMLAKSKVYVLGTGNLRRSE